MSVKKFCRCACALLVVCVLTQAQDMYSTKYDDVDLDEVLASERLLSGYIKCLMSEGPCTADAKELKNNLPDAIADDCSKCSEKQRSGSAKVMHHIIDQRPEDWRRLESIYDPKGTYRKTYLESKNTSKEKNSGEATNEDEDTTKE